MGRRSMYSESNPRKLMPRMKEEICSIGRHLIMLNAYTLGNKAMLPLISQNVNEEVKRVLQPEFAPVFDIMRDPRYDSVVYGSSTLDVEIETDLGMPHTTDWYPLERYITVTLSFTGMDKVPNVDYLNKSSWLNLDNPLVYWARDNSLQIAKTWKTANRLAGLFSNIVNSCNTVGALYSWMPETFTALAEQMQSEVLRQYKREPKPVALEGASERLGVPDPVKAMKMMHVLMVKGMLLRATVRDGSSTYYSKEIGRLRGDISIAFSSDRTKPA